MEQFDYMPEKTPEYWIDHGVCPYCLHDTLKVSDGQFCMGCGFFTGIKPTFGGAKK